MLRPGWPYWHDLPIGGNFDTGTYSGTPWRLQWSLKYRTAETAELKTANVDDRSEKCGINWISGMYVDGGRWM